MNDRYGLKKGKAKYGTRKNSDVILVKDARLGSTPQTWSLRRVGEGAGRGEGFGFTSVPEAEEFCKKYGHKIVRRCAWKDL